jgi:hypothetical protein
MESVSISPPLGGLGGKNQAELMVNPPLAPPRRGTLSKIPHASNRMPQTAYLKPHTPNRIPQTAHPIKKNSPGENRQSPGVRVYGQDDHLFTKNSLYARGAARQPLK